MHVLSLLEGRRTVGRRTHQRMAEAHARADLEQVRPRGRACRLRQDAELARPLARPAAGHRWDRPPREAAGVASPRECSSRRRKLSSMLLESGNPPGSPKPPASSAGDNSRSSSSKASGLPRVSATIWSRTRASSGPVSTESSSARASASRKPSTTSSGNPPGRRSRAPRRAGADRFCLQPPRNEREHLRRGAIEPLLVIHHADQRLLLGHVGEQAQTARPTKKRSGAGPGLRPNAVCSASRCGPGDARRDPASAPTADATRRTKLHLRLDTEGAHHAEARRCARRGTPKAPSCPRPARRAAPAPGSRPREPRRAARRASRTLRRPRSSGSAFEWESMDHLVEPDVTRLHRTRQTTRASAGDSRTRTPPCRRMHAGRMTITARIRPGSPSSLTTRRSPRPSLRSKSTDSASKSSMTSTPRAKPSSPSSPKAPP